MYDYVFPENGLVAYHNGELFNKMVSFPAAASLHCLQTRRRLYLCSLRLIFSHCLCLYSSFPFLLIFSYSLCNLSHCFVSALSLSPLSLSHLLPLSYLLSLFFVSALSVSTVFISSFPAVLSSLTFFVSALFVFISSSPDVFVPLYRA